MSFSPEERGRYARHLNLPGFGSSAQERLRAGRVLVVGCGGLGSPALAYLAAAGVGHLGFMDGDIVSLSNLQRQILHTTPDIGRPKVESAEAHLRALNPHIALEPFAGPLTPENAQERISAYDLVLDATDNFSAKYLISDTCCAAGKPFVFAGLSATGGQWMTVLPGRTPCLRCLFPEAPETAEKAPDAPPPAPAGPLAALPGIIGSLQAMEAIKFLTGTGTLQTDALLLYDALNGTFRSIRALRRPECPACGRAALD